LFFHHGEHGSHGEIFVAHVAVSCGSWLKFSFFDRIEAERRKTDLGSPEGERSESIDKIKRMGENQRKGTHADCSSVALWPFAANPPRALHTL
jgi:hypothetical protein